MMKWKILRNVMRGKYIVGHVLIKQGIFYLLAMSLAPDFFPGGKTAV